MRAGIGQTLIDVAVERTGRVQTAWDIAVATGCSLTDLIEGGEAAEVEAKGNRRVLRSYAQDGTHPATELTEGIGGWRIGQFIIS
ncbi:MAG: hypothetical protein J6I49_03630 [Bacteroidales bacterium]|nr:hypothetical protein [Bacteroidales bacterium]